MEERQEQLLESILEELQEFNARFNDELERAENERTLQAIEDSDNATKLAEEQQKALETEAEKEQEELEKLEQQETLDNERFEAIETFFKDTNDLFAESREFYESSSTTIDAISNEIAREDLLKEMQQLNEQLDNAYTVVAEQGKPYVERFDYVVTVIAFILLGVLPIYFIIKWLYWQLNIFR